MTERPPIPSVFRDGAFWPLPAFAKLATRHYGEGEVGDVEFREERSSASHRHMFALIREAWLNLTEEQAERFPTAEHLRKWCLIKAGYRDERTVLCASKAEAQRIAAFIRPMDEFAVVSVAGTAVVVMTAKSQSLRAMGKTDFTASKRAVLDILAGMIGVEPDTLSRAAVDSVAPNKRSEIAA